jgi:hypothetical protein
VGLAEDIAADQMMDDVVAVVFVMVMTAALPLGPGFPRDPPSKNKMYCSWAHGARIDSLLLSDIQEWRTRRLMHSVKE